MSQIMYIAILFAVVWMGWVAEKKDKKIYLFPLIFLLTFISGFRGENCGVDTPAYYENIIKGFPYPWLFREEGFRSVANFVMDKLENPQIVFVLCAFITNFLILMRLWDFKNKANFGFMNFLYILLYYSNSMNIMRQYVAVSIIFYGTRYLKKRKLFFILFLVMSFNVHRSSLLAIGYLGIEFWRGFSRKQKVLFSMPMALGVVVTIVYLRAYFAHDINSYSMQVVDNINITYFYLLFCTLLVLIMQRENVRVKIVPYSLEKRKNNNKIDKSIALYVLIGLAFNALSMFFAFVGRTGLYYSIYNVVFWGISCKEFKNPKLNKMLILIYAIYVFALVIIRNDIKIFPYKVFFY